MISDAEHALLTVGAEVAFRARVVLMSCCGRGFRTTDPNLVYAGKVTHVGDEHVLIVSADLGTGRTFRVDIDHLIALAPIEEREWLA